MVCVKQQSLNDIQIATLCREAKVSRMFYYRHFTSKEGIITDKFQREYQQYLRIIRKYKIHDPHQMAFEFFEFFRGFRDTTQELIDADLGYLVDYNFRDYFKDMLANHVIHGNQQYPDYWIAFAVGGLSQLLFSWIQKGTPESSTEMANIFFSFTEPIQD
ncbi:MAG TPA: hypothetical protein DCW31_09950 [Lactobacillus sp.]|nr:hypothetical protein [Lactobacillus sp.]